MNLSVKYETHFITPGMHAVMVMTGAKNLDGIGPGLPVDRSLRG
jgi:hypothetical protein